MALMMAFPSVQVHPRHPLHPACPAAFMVLPQFLPQDKVVEFARLNPYELLIATEKAIGDSSLYDTHMELIQRRDAMKTREQVRPHRLQPFFGVSRGGGTPTGWPHTGQSAVCRCLSGRQGSRDPCWFMSWCICV